MVDPCDRILGAKTLYEVLEVEKDCSGDQIKRSYRKIAIQVHPDRCKHPKATEAFQKVAHAYQTLSDEDKRAHYDRFGDEQPRPTPRQDGGQQYYRAYGSGPYGAYYRFDDEMSADEIFNMFFGGGMPAYRRQYRRQENPQPANWQSILRMMIPTLLMLLLMMGPNIQKFFDPNSDFDRNIFFDSKHKNDKRFKEFKSIRYGKHFYCSTDWLRGKLAKNSNNKTFYNDLRKEADILFEYNLRQKCQYERSMYQRQRPACEEMRRYNIY